jgi:hypothetical protein
VATLDSMTFCYEVVWQRLAYEYNWIEREQFDTSERVMVRMVGRLNLVLPLIGWTCRPFHSRRVYLRKKAAPQAIFFVADFWRSER